MSKRLVLSYGLIGAVLLLFSTATYAYFNETSTSSGNILGANTLTMSLSNDNIAYADNVTGTIGSNGLNPGDLFNGDLFIKNNGNSSANHLDLSFKNAVVNASSGPGTGTSPTFSSVLEVQQLMWDADGDGVAETNMLPATCDTASTSNHNGICDLQDLENLGVSGAADVPNLLFEGTQNAGHKLHVAGRLSSLATNVHQGDSDTLSLTIFMDQGPHS